MPYVSTVDLELAYLDDRLHLTPAGHRTFGDAVAARIALLSSIGREARDPLEVGQDPEQPVEGVG